MTSQNTNEMDEMLKRLKSSPGFQACFILNNDGVVLRWENKSNHNDMEEGLLKLDEEEQEEDDKRDNDFVLTYEKAVHYAGHVLDVYHESKKAMSALMEDTTEKQVESIRIRTDHHELLATQEGNYILVVLYK